jgi:hypothetical protein
MVDSKKIKKAFPKTTSIRAHVLFLERINPTKMLLRVAPISQEKSDYENLYIKLNKNLNII